MESSMLVPFPIRDRIPITDRSIRLASIIHPSDTITRSRLVPASLDAGADGHGYKFAVRYRKD